MHGIKSLGGLRPQTWRLKAEGICTAGRAGPKNRLVLFLLQTKSVVFRRQRRAFLLDSDSPQRLPALKRIILKVSQRTPY